MSEGDFCASAAQHFQLSSASPFTPSFVSDVESLVLTQTWKVNNFSLLLKLAPPNFCLRSTILKCSSMPGVNWQLCLYPGCRRFDNACNVSLLVRLFTTPPRSEVVIKAECRLLLVGDNDEIKFCNVNTVVFHARPPRKEYLWGSRNIPENTIRQCIRADHSLLIKCSIEFLPEASSIPCRQMPPSDTVKMKMTEVSHLHVENELAKMLSAENSDADLSLTVEFGSEREVFAVHKFKLITHSEVFATMFDHNTKESKTYAITIEGYSISAVRNLLVFIYTGSVSLGNLELEEVFHVMLLADKYIIPALKSMCEQELISRVRPTNVAECVELADFCGANVLYEHCLSLMKEDRHVIFNTESWLALKDRNPALTITIMERMV